VTIEQIITNLSECSYLEKRKNSPPTVQTGDKENKLQNTTKIVLRVIPSSD